MSEQVSSQVCPETPASVKVFWKCVWESRSVFQPKADVWVTHERGGEGPAHELYEYLTKLRQPTKYIEVRNVRLMRRVVEDTGWECRRHVLGVVDSVEGGPSPSAAQQTASPEEPQ